MHFNYRRPLFAALPLALLGCPQRSAVWVRTPATTQHLVFELGHRRGKPDPIELWTLEVTECRTGGKPAWRLAINRALLAPDYERPMWAVDPSARRDYAAVEYGRVPQGYVEESPATSLVSGRCYLVRTQAAGSGVTAFRVTGNGKVTELSASETETVLGGWQHGIVGEDGSIRRFTSSEEDSARREWRAPQVADSIAHARCYAGYRSARTESDSAQVDREVPYDTTADGLLTHTDYPGRRLTCKFVCTKIGPSVGPEEASRRSICSAPIRKP